MTKRKSAEVVHIGLSKEDAKAIRNAPDGTLFTSLWRNKYLATEASTFDEFREALADAVALLDRWKALGIELEDDGGVEDDYATFSTTSKSVALAEGFSLCQVGSDDDDDDIIDWPFGGSFSWPFGPDNLPASPEALMVELAKSEAALHAEVLAAKEFNVPCLARLSGFDEIKIRFPHFFQGDEHIKHIGDGSHNMSWAEIIWLLHISIMKDNLGDHIFFEGLQTVGTDGDIPMFDAVMGS